MSERSSSPSFNSENYLQVVGDYVFGEGQAKQANEEPTASRTTATAKHPEDNVSFCVCRVCQERRKTSINRHTQFQVEFQLHNLRNDDKLLLRKLIEQCRWHKVTGYIIYTYEREDAMGLMEGSTKAINKIRDWLHEQTKHIPQPRAENIYFSCFLIARHPTKLHFAERTKPPPSSSNISEFTPSD